MVVPNNSGATVAMLLTGAAARRSVFPESIEASVVPAVPGL